MLRRLRALAARRILRLALRANVAAFPWAVTDSTGFAELFTSRTNPGGHLLYEWPEKTSGSLPVRTVALDGVDVIRPPLDLVKIDAQGADDFAVKGMAGLLERSPRATVLVEFWPWGIRLRGDDPRGVLDFYRPFARVLVLPPDSGRPLLPSDEEILEYCAGDEGRRHVNLLLER